MMRCAANAMDCNPELQNRLMLSPRRARGKAGTECNRARDITARGAFAEGGAHDHILDLGGVDAGAFQPRAAPHVRQAWRHKSC